MNTNARPWIIFGACCIVLIFAGFGGWAATAHLSSAVITQGVMAVDGKRKLVQHLEGGIVETLMVRDGDVVAAGDGLITLDPIRPRSMLAIITSSLLKELASEARLIAERDGSDKISYRAELAAEVDSAEVRALTISQNAIFEARRTSLKGEVAILEQRIAQLGDETKGLTAQRKSKQRQMEFITEELNGLRQLMALGQTTKPRILQLERSAAASSVRKANCCPALRARKRQLAKPSCKSFSASRTSKRASPRSWRQFSPACAIFRSGRSTARDVLRRINITAPVGGTVVNMAAHSVGAVIKPGETVLEIVPGKDNLVVEVSIRPQDIDIVTLEQAAAIRLLAFKQRTTPLLHGKVMYVSADSLENPTTRQQYYVARIAVPDEEIAKARQTESAARDASGSDDPNRRPHGVPISCPADG